MAAAPMPPLLRRSRSLLRSAATVVRRRPKVFCIGYNKSGTTSLHELFQTLGYHSLHSTIWGDTARRLIHHRYECFSDAVPDDFRVLDRRFPNSRFILQVRELDRWVVSRLAHIQRGVAKGRDYDLPGWVDADESIGYWLGQRQAHHRAVLDHFATQPERLLVVNVCSDSDWEPRVAAFVGASAPPPRSRVANRRPASQSVDALRARVARVLEQLGVPPEEQGNDLLCPALLEVGARYPARSADLPPSLRGASV